MNDWKGKGFYYSVSDQAMRDYRKLSLWERLQWLLQANLFVEKFAPPRVKKLHELFRSARI